MRLAFFGRRICSVVFAEVVLFWRAGSLDGFAQTSDTTEGSTLMIDVEETPANTKLTTPTDESNNDSTALPGSPAVGLALGLVGETHVLHDSSRICGLKSCDKVL